MGCISPLGISGQLRATSPTTDTLVCQFSYAPQHIEFILTTLLPFHCSVEFLPYEDNGRLVLSGGALGCKEYQLVQFHFHWGAENDTGSEHLINDQQYAMEVHLVHYNMKYESIEYAAKMPDGLAVLAFLVKDAGKNAYNPFLKVRRKG